MLAVGSAVALPACFRLTTLCAAVPPYQRVRKPEERALFLPLARSVWDAGDRARFQQTTLLVLDRKTQACKLFPSVPFSPAHWACAILPRVEFPATLFYGEEKAKHGGKAEQLFAIGTYHK